MICVYLYASLTVWVWALKWHCTRKDVRTTSSSGPCLWPLFIATYARLSGLGVPGSLLAALRLTVGALGLQTLATVSTLYGLWIQAKVDPCAYMAMFPRVNYLPSPFNSSKTPNSYVNSHFKRLFKNHYEILSGKYHTKLLKITKLI